MVSAPAALWRRRDRSATIAPMEKPDWYYDDLKQIGTDFTDAREVATYDERQSDTAEDDVLLARLGLAASDTLADIGCGTGRLACAAAKLCRAVHAIDISAPMLAATGRRAAALGLVNITPQQAGFLSFALPQASLDLVTTKFALHHLPDQWKGVALDRMAKALKPGGILFIRDVVFSCHPADLPTTAEAWIAWMLANTGYDRATVACHLRDEHSTYGWIMEGLITQAGFDLLSAEYSNGVYADYLARKPRPQ
ncbi:MAG: class I SAM-dependent methyltransferase [Parvibaculaceae bacterium]